MYPGPRHRYVRADRSRSPEPASLETAIISARKRRWPRLLLLVFAASLALVAVTAAALVRVVTDHVTSTAIDSTAGADQALVQSFVESNLVTEDMTMGASEARVAAVEGLLTRLVASDVGVVRFKVHAIDGTVLFSDDRELRGQHFAISEKLAAALAGRRNAVIQSDLREEEADLAGGGATAVIEEYLPILGPDGGVEAAFEIYRDAAPILAAVGNSQAAVLLITLVAALFLAGLLWAIFHAAQARLDAQTEQLVEAARRDALTGLLNHGSAVEALVDLVEGARSAREAGQTPVVGIALIDIDNFGNLNDTHGHGAGDRALREVSRILGEELSQSSVVGRYGPDEFIAIAPPECAHDLEPAVHRLRARLVDLSLQFGVSERLPVTVSAGLCTYPVHGSAATELLSVATVALGEAKAGGGDGVRLADDPADEQRAIERGSFDVLQGLVIAVDNKDRYTKHHSEDVATYALFLADRLGLEPEMRRTLQIAGLLHDVGKIGIPDTILRKPGPLTVDEYEIVKQHVALGHLIVRDLPHLELVRAGVRHHHERWDGSGYLDRLAGEEIPLIARLLAVGDAFSAMTSTRPYRKALSIEEALRRLEDAAGSQLDPTLVTAFVRGIETSPDAPLPGMAPACTLVLPFASGNVA
jgi:diguanylate cyclase (GGDEF)-like protein